MYLLRNFLKVKKSHPRLVDINCSHRFYSSDCLLRNVLIYSTSYHVILISTFDKRFFHEKNGDRFMHKFRIAPCVHTLLEYGCRGSKSPDLEEDLQGLPYFWDFLSLFRFWRAVSHFHDSCVKHHDVIWYWWPALLWACPTQCGSINDTIHATYVQ